MKRNSLPILLAAVLVAAGAATVGAVWAAKSRAAGEAASAQRARANEGVGLGELTVPPTIQNVTATRTPVRTIPGVGDAAVEIIIHGTGYYGTSVGPFVRLNGRDALAVIMDEQSPDKRLIAYGPASLAGKIEVVVENPDRQSVRAFVDLK